MMKRFRILMTVCALGVVLCVSAGCGDRNGKSNNNSVTEGSDREDKDKKEKDRNS